MSDAAELPIPTSDFAIIVYSDIGCPWANIAVHRLSHVLLERGLDREIRIDHRAYPLEVLADEQLSSAVLDAAVRVCRDLEPSAPWPGGPGPWRFTRSTMVALEAVQAAKEQGVEASIRLDAACRRAMFEDLANLGSLSTVVEVARSVDTLDVDALEAALRSGHGRAEVHRHIDDARADEIAGSPTLVLPDGSVHLNPGISMHWDGRPGERLVIDADDPDAFGELIDRTLATRPAD